MSDIFISYSSHDRDKAEQLTELLSSAGLSVWIDQSGIGAATSWSGEISKAITDCKALIVLLSPSSVDSKNVTREVALAFERNKRILPIDLEPVSLPDDFAYHLAGIQRCPMTNIDSIIRALGKLGLEATGAPQAPRIVKEESGKKSLMILPFEDMSPTGDNGWFADGLASELVNTLSNVKSLKLVDWNTSSMLKNKKVRTVDLAKDFSVRYFIEGQVRKFGDQIKISVTLLDIETGDHLWRDSLRGTMEDIFDIQEQCAEKVLSGLKLHMTNEEAKKVSKLPTENAEAYELLLKGNECINRQTRYDYERAIVLNEEAARLDPGFAVAHLQVANACAQLFRFYTRSEALLERAEAAAGRARDLDGDTARYFSVMSMITIGRGKAEEALDLAKRAIETDPGFAPGYSALGFAYKALGMKEEEVQAWEALVRLNGNNTGPYFSLLIALNELGNSPEVNDRVRRAAEQAIPVFERHLRLNPDDYYTQVALANVYRYAGRYSEARAEAEKLAAVGLLDGGALYNLACLYLQLDDTERGMATLRRSVEKGYRAIEAFRRDPDLDPLREREDFQAMMKELEAEQHG